MEDAIGRRLPLGSRVRHLNAAPNDNRIENLFLELPGEPTLRMRLRWTLSRCVACDSDHFVDPKILARCKSPRRALFCSPWCYYRGRPPPCSPTDRIPEPKHPRKGADPDRWRTWTPQIAAAARMIPDPDPGPGKPGRYPVIEIPDPPDDLPYWAPAYSPKGRARPASRANAL